MKKISQSNFNDFITQELLFLLRTREDEDDFYTNYYTCDEKIFFAITSYREKKRNEIIFTELEFIKIYMEDKKEALERLFMYPMSQQEITLLEDSIHIGNITLEKLYRLKNKHKKRRLPRLLISTI